MIMVVTFVLMLDLFLSQSKQSFAFYGKLNYEKYLILHKNTSFESFDDFLLRLFASILPDTYISKIINALE
jgi:hypothetical protein